MNPPAVGVSSMKRGSPSPSPKVKARTFSTGGSIAQRIMKGFFPVKSDEPNISNEMDDSQSHSENERATNSSSSFRESMKKRHSLLQSLLHNSDSLHCASPPPSVNTSPCSSPRSTSPYCHSHPSSGRSGSSTVLSSGRFFGTGLTPARSPPSRTASARSTMDSAGESIASSISASNSNHSLNSYNSESEREKVHSMYMQDLSLEIDLREVKFRHDASTNEKIVVGEGSIATVLLAEWNGTPCAVKRMSAMQAGKLALHKFQSEIALLMSLRHPNIVQVFGGCWPPESGDGDSKCSLFNTCIVMEYCSLGSLFGVLSKHGSTVPWSNPCESENSLLQQAGQINMTPTSKKEHLLGLQYKFDWCRQIARGMAYLHSKKTSIIHRDLKCSNVLVNKNFILKISDFGDSRRRHKLRLKQDNGEMVDQAGTLFFMAPEVVSEQAYDISVDVYSFATLLMEIVCNGDLSKIYDVPATVAAHKSSEGWRPALDYVEEVNKEVANLIRSCWDHAPDKRPTFNEIVEKLNTIIDDDDSFGRSSH